jgi:hypothetical protein
MLVAEAVAAVAACIWAVAAAAECMLAGSGVALAIARMCHIQSRGRVWAGQDGAIGRAGAIDQVGVTDPGMGLGGAPPPLERVWRTQLTPDTTATMASTRTTLVITTTPWLPALSVFVHIIRQAGRI